MASLELYMYHRHGGNFQVLSSDDELTFWS